MKKILVSLIAVFVLSIAANCSTTKMVKFNSPLPITTGSFGGSFKSLGVIYVRDGGLGSATFGPNITEVGQGTVQSNAATIHQETLDDATKTLNDRLIAEAKKMGGNAIINVRYGASEMPIFIPFIGPLAVWGSYASGEIIVTTEAPTGLLKK